MSRSKIRQKIDEWFVTHVDDMIRDVGRLVAIKSVRGSPHDGAPYGEGSREALKLARSMLEDMGFEVTDFEDIIITADINEKPPELGILAHLDVVGTAGGWDSDPFEMSVRDGKLYGRGTSDDKGPAVAAMYAMRAARDIEPDMTRGFRLILGSGEEIGCEDIEQYLGKIQPPPCVFTPDSNFPVVNIEKGRFVPLFGADWEKDTVPPRVITVKGGITANIVPNRAEAVIEGIPLEEAERYCREYSEITGAALSASADGGRVRIVSNGTAAHASKPEDGVNAQTALITALAAMPFRESGSFRYIRTLARLFPHGDYYGNGLGIGMSDTETGILTLNFGVLNFTESGFTGNFDSRTPSCADKTDIIEETRARLLRDDIKITAATATRCHHTPEDSDFVKTLLRIYEEFSGNKGECLALGGTTYVHNIPGGVAFGCEMPGIDNRIHGANEFIGIDQLVMSAKMFTQAILDICGSASGYCREAP